MAQFDPDNLRIARPSEVLGNIKVTVCIHCLGRFLMKRRNTNKTITLANHKLRKIQSTNQNSKRIHVAGVKGGKTRASASSLVQFFLMIGLESGASQFIVYQPLSAVMQTQCKCKFLSIVYSDIWFDLTVNVFVYVYFVYSLS